MNAPLRFACRIVPRHVDILRLDGAALFREILAQLRHKFLELRLVDNRCAIQYNYVVETLLEFDLVPTADS